MTKTELIDIIAKKRNIPRKDAVLIVNGIFEQMTKSLLKGDRIEIRGFGIFTVKTYPSYKGRNPKTKTTIQVQPKRKPIFKVGKDLKERINPVEAAK